MNTSRIPAYDSSIPDGMTAWFSAMAKRDLLFHPEDSAKDIILTSNGNPMFTPEESEVVDGILSKMFSEHGDMVLATCYPLFMEKAGFSGNLDA